MCGPKVAACGIVLGSWGVIMLSMLGIFFSTHSAVLIEDLPLQEHASPDTNRLQRIYEVYEKVGTNCFIAAVIYFLVGAFSWWQMRLNRQRVYLVH